MHTYIHAYTHITKYARTQNVFFYMYTTRDTHTVLVAHAHTCNDMIMQRGLEGMVLPQFSRSNMSLDSRKSSLLHPRLPNSVSQEFSKVVELVALTPTFNSVAHTCSNDFASSIPTRLHMRYFYLEILITRKERPFKTLYSDPWHTSFCLTRGGRKG